MTVDELRSELEGLPGTTEVVTIGRSGEDAGSFYEIKGVEAAREVVGARMTFAGLKRVVRRAELDRLLSTDEVLVQTARGLEWLGSAVHERLATGEWAIVFRTREVERDGG